MDNNRIPERLYQWTPTHGKPRSGCLKQHGTEETEVAAQDRSGWKFLSSQAAGAELHKADW